MSYNTYLIGAIISDLITLRDRLREEDKAELAKGISVTPDTDKATYIHQFQPTPLAPAFRAESQQQRHYYGAEVDKEGTDVFPNGPARAKWYLEDTKVRRYVKKEDARHPYRYHNS